MERRLLGLCQGRVLFSHDDLVGRTWLRVDGHRTCWGCGAGSLLALGLLALASIGTVMTGSRSEPQDLLVDHVVGVWRTVLGPVLVAVPVAVS